MGEIPGNLSFERIVIAFATVESQRHSLESIARLAAGHNAEVSGVFIEDADMLRAASLPFALEVCRATNIVRRVDSDEIERGLRERALVARKLVAETARQSGAKWSFQVVRQRTATAVLDLARETDVTVLSTTSSSRYRDQTMPRKGNFAGRTAYPGESIVVLFDQSAASGRAILLAHKLAEIRRLPIRAVVVAASQEDLDRLTGQLQRTVGLDSSLIHRLRRPNFGEILSSIHALHPAATVLPLALVKGSSERIHGLEQAIDNPILIVK